MATRIVKVTFKVEDVLTDVDALPTLSDSDATFGIQKDSDSSVIVAAGTVMTKESTGVYTYPFTDEVGETYTAWVRYIKNGTVNYFERDFEARSATGTMVASYSSLLERVGHFLFGIRSGYSSDQTDDIEECITDGLHDVYQAHTWSFFRPIKPITTTAPYKTGTVTVVDGVVTLAGGTFPDWAAVGVLKVDNGYYEVDTRDGDTQVTLENTSVDVDALTTFELCRPLYDLPDNFESVEGNLTYEPGQNCYYREVEVRDDSEIRRLSQYTPYTTRPFYYGIRTVEFDPTVGSRRRLSLYPLPDDVYVLNVRMKLRSTMIDAVNQFPIGAETLTQVITEACLAAAERNYDEQGSVHTERFQTMLPLAITADLDMTSPRLLGPDAPADERTRRTIYQPIGDISVDGVIQ